MLGTIGTRVSLILLLHENPEGVASRELGLLRVLDFLDRLHLDAPALGHLVRYLGSVRVKFAHTSCCYWVAIKYYQSINKYNTYD